jgi:hypothetical protein
LRRKILSGPLLYIYAKELEKLIEVKSKDKKSAFKKKMKSPKKLDILEALKVRLKVNKKPILSQAQVREYFE